jgi:hypothetical protein
MPPAGYASIRLESWADWDFGQKKVPITLHNVPINRIEKRLKEGPFLGNEMWSSEVRAWLTDVSGTKNFSRAEQDVASDRHGSGTCSILSTLTRAVQNSTRRKNPAQSSVSQLLCSIHILMPSYSGLDSPNAFIQWGGIFILGNLVTVDGDRKFPALFERFFALLNQPAMITAANCVATASRIIQRYPELEPEITRRLLAVTANTYYRKNQPSPECKNILLGHVLDSLDGYYDQAIIRIRSWIRAVADP